MPLSLGKFTRQFSDLAKSKVTSPISRVRSNLTARAPAAPARPAARPVARPAPSRAISQPAPTAQPAAPRVPPEQSYRPAQGPLDSIVQGVGQHLSPMEQFSKVLPYETYAAPQQEAFRLWNEETFRPEFERYTMNPWTNQYGANLASSGAGYMGGAQEKFQRARDQVMQQSYHDPLEQARRSYDDMMRQGYQQQMRDYYTNPAAFTGGI